MSELQISLPDTISQFAASQVASGRFTSVEEYLQALISADAETQKTLEKLSNSRQVSELLHEGLESPPGRIWGAEVFEDIKQKIFDSESGSNT